MKIKGANVIKKIALVLISNPTDGGQHQYAMLVVRALLEKADKKLELVAICGNPFWRRWCRERKIRYLSCSLPSISKREQIFNYKYSKLSRLYYTYATLLGKIIVKEKIDILFSTCQGYFIPNYKVKLITPVHDLMHRYESKFPEVRMDYQNRERYMKSMAEYARCILVDSKLGKNNLKKLI